MYFNTTNQTGNKLIAEWNNADTQEKRIMGIFLTKRSLMTAPQVHGRYIELYPELSNTPLTSIRRGITVLTNKGKLIKTGELAVGYYGKLNYKYKLANNQLEIF